MLIPHVAPGQGQTSLCGQNSDVNRKVVEKKIFEWWTMDDDGPWLYYKLTNERKGSGELKI